MQKLVSAVMHISNGNGFRPMGEMVNGGQNVGKALRWWEWTHNVNMYVVIFDIWGCKCGKWCLAFL